jgi:hypothetical protein
MEKEIKMIEREVGTPDELAMKVRQAITALDV